MYPLHWRTFANSTMQIVMWQIEIRLVPWLIVCMDLVTYVLYYDMCACFVYVPMCVLYFVDFNVLRDYNWQIEKEYSSLATDMKFIR